MGGRYEQLLARAVAALRSERGLSDEPPEELALTIHLMNRHGSDFGGARERVGPAKGLGVIGWWLDGDSGTLSIYQTFLGEDRKGMVAALGRLASVVDKAAQAIGQTNTILIEDQPLRALAKAVAASTAAIKLVEATILSQLADETVEQFSAFEQAQSQLQRSAWRTTLHCTVTLKHGRIALRRGAELQVSAYELAGALTGPVKVEGATALWAGLVGLGDLIGLYDSRGPSIFDKNVRYTLTGKDAQSRVAGPMRLSLAQVASGELSPQYFTAYHVGVTLVASDCQRVGENAVSLENPYVINGCQSISTAHAFWRNRHKAGDDAGLERLGRINVMAKIVVQPSEEHSHEISNSNNRQNPIEPWQLFCNDRVHVEIESSLRRIGVFYERQKGRFSSIAKSSSEWAKKAPLPPMDLGAAVALAMGDLQLAGHPRRIFDDKETHDALFTSHVASRPLSCLFAVNAARAVRHGLKKYTEGDYYEEVRLRLSAHPDARSLLHHIAFRALVKNVSETGHQLVGKLYKRAPSSEEWTAPIFRGTVKRVSDAIKDDGRWGIARRDSLHADMLAKHKLDDSTFDLFAPESDMEERLAKFVEIDLSIGDLLGLGE